MESRDVEFNPFLIHELDQAVTLINVRDPPEVPLVRSDLGADLHAHCLKRTPVSIYILAIR